MKSKLTNAVLIHGFNAIFLVLVTPVFGDNLVFINNKAANPPLVDEEKVNCSVELHFTDAKVQPTGKEQHAYLVITKPDKTQVEVRGGPQSGPDSGTGSSRQAVGNPFQCSTEHKFGVVVPYVGIHGVLGQDSDKDKVYSPDGGITAPNASIKIEKSAQKNLCQLANCIMLSVKSSGSMCKDYILGVKWMRNSNTIISNALAMCGVSDPIPKGVLAPGWGERW